jgi:hypothetical protein
MNTPKERTIAACIRILQADQLNALAQVSTEINRHRREFETIAENIDHSSLNAHDFHERLSKACTQYGYNYQIELHNSRSQYAFQKPQLAGV